MKTLKNPRYGVGGPKGAERSLDGYRIDLLTLGVFLWNILKS
jgi:hypothetical protein